MAEPKDKSHVTSIKLPRPLVAALDDVADRAGISRSAVMRTAVLEHLSKEEISE